MLATYPADDDLLATLSTDGVVAGPADLPGADDRDLEPGARIGPYVIVDLIGRGGMGRVYLGSDPRLRRKVALKCLSPSSGNANADTRRAQIIREARAAARVMHAHVATIHDVIEDGERAFIVMEYVEGESLSWRLKRGQMPIDRVVRVGLELASALAAAHAKGVVHRDLKPSNVQFAADGSVKVLDFGIANAVQTLSTVRSTAPTTTPSETPADAGQARLRNAGTPQYMSPEQLLGRAVDERSDIYSLGLILHEMSTGRRVHPTDDTLEIAAAQARGISRADVVDPRVPRGLADAIAKALDPDVNQRSQKATDVEAALKAVEQDLLRHRPNRAELFRLWLARVAVGAPLVILAIATLGAIKTFGFNYSFGRSGPFARFGSEPWPSYFRWGVLGIVPRLVVMTGTAVAVMGAGMLLRLLELVEPVGRAARRVDEQRRHVALALGLQKPATLAQAFAALGIVMIVGIAWLHADLLFAWTVSFNSAPIAKLLPMGESAPERNAYQNELTMVLLVLAYGLYKVMRLRAHEQTRDGRGAVTALMGVMVVALLMSDAPYRTFNYRDFERADLAGLRCYITGESGDELLLLCPASSPPRNRVVRRGDPALTRPGNFENVFRGVPADR